jgi:hypothetical protein
MVRILHISDPHGQTETMARLTNLATFQSEWDVVALTGDCVSQTSKQVPPGWDVWPQRLKLSVPGNHDGPNTFDLLPTWRHQAPWVCRLDDLIFIGLDSPLPDRVKKHLCGVDWDGARGVVLLFHERPRIETDSLAAVLRVVVDSRELLILHGHEHPASFSGAESGISQGCSVGRLTFGRKSAARFRVSAGLVTSSRGRRIRFVAERCRAQRHRCCGRGPGWSTQFGAWGRW